MYRCGWYRGGGSHAGSVHLYGTTTGEITVGNVRMHMYMYMYEHRVFVPWLKCRMRLLINTYMYMYHHASVFVLLTRTFAELRYSSCLSVYNVGTCTCTVHQSGSKNWRDVETEE